MLAGALCGAYLGGRLQPDALWVAAVIAVASAIATLLIPATTQPCFAQKTTAMPPASHNRRSAS
jgi:uncharacterized membrane protein YoaK (UPF0700 family)